MKTFLVLTTLALGAGSALARGDEGCASPVRADGQALLTPAQAQTIAEARTGGRVVRTRFDHACAVYRFDLALPGSAGAQSVEVAAAGGALQPGESGEAQAAVR